MNHCSHQTGPQSSMTSPECRWIQPQVPTNHLRQRRDSSSSENDLPVYQWEPSCHDDQGIFFSHHMFGFLRFLRLNVGMQCFGGNLPGTLCRGASVTQGRAHLTPPHALAIDTLSPPLSSSCTRGRFKSRCCFQWHQNDHHMPQGNPIKWKQGSSLCLILH